MPPPRKPNPPRTSSTPQSSQRRGAAQQNSAPELIDPRWLLKALAIVLAVALLLAWGTLCLLWYQGQWQLVLHPSREVPPMPAILSSLCHEVHFYPDESGHPQLDGWLCSPEQRFNRMVVGPSVDPSMRTVLLLNDGSGDSTASMNRAMSLLNAHLNVLLFDYRGYGHSTGQHPTQATMQQDADAAFRFLTDTQYIHPIVPYGHGIGASLAVNLATQHHEIPAIILDAPSGDLTDRVVRDAHSWLIPVRLLFHETFPLAEPLRTLATPKLLISYNTTQPSAALANAADPKVTVEVPSPDDAALLPAIQRFLDQYANPIPPLRR